MARAPRPVQKTALANSGALSYIADMDSHLLQRCGEALYGPRWHSDLARDLDVSDRTVRRWVAGDEVPEGVYLDLLQVCSQRAAELDDLIAALPQNMNHNEKIR